MTALRSRCGQYIFCPVVSSSYGQAIIFLPCGFYLPSFFFLSLWSPYVIGQTIIFLHCDFSFFPRLISAVGDWMSTILPHMLWPSCEFRMHV